MAERPIIPSRHEGAIRAFIEAIRGGAWNKGGQIVLNVSPQGDVTSVECKGRIE